MVDLLRYSADYLIFALIVLAGCGAVGAWLGRRRLRAQLPRAFWLVMFALLLAGYFYVESAGRRPQQRVITLFEGIAPTYADELARMGHADLRIETAADDPRYLAMIEALKRWEKLNPLVSDIYTFRRLPDGTVVLMLDAETDYDGDGHFAGTREERTRPGEVYPQVEEELLRAFAGERNFMKSPVTDRWGTWVSAHVPMLDAQGRVEAVLGMDYRADLWRADKDGRRRVAIGYLAVVFIILLGSGASIAIYRSELAARTEAESRLRASLGEVERENAERRAAELARRESDARLDLHVQQTPLAYVEWAPDLRIIRWNPAAERIFGYTADEVLGRSFLPLIVPPAAHAEVEAVCGRLSVSREPVHHSNENLTKDGRTIVCEWHNTPLVAADGKLLAVASHAQEITERVRIEQHLRQAQKLESMGQLAGGVAHEFNNLLTPMLMQMGQIQSAYADDPRLLEMLRPVEDSIMQAAQLNQRILTVGRRQPDTRLPGDLNQLIGVALDLLRHTLDRRIELVVELAPRLPPAMLSRGAIVQVVMNLALNARDSLLSRLSSDAPPGWSPRLSVRTGRSAPPPGAPASLREAPECLRLEIGDNGEGMSPEVRRRVFEPFFTTKPAGQGTGLGLAVVLSVVESLGGQIDLKTAPGSGAVFTVYLPSVATLAPAPLRPPGERAPSGPAEKGLRLLLIEDNQLVRETFHDVLNQAGHYVVAVEDGEQGLRRLEEGGTDGFDVLVTDLNLPRLSGRDVLERIRGRGLARGVVVVSGLLDPQLDQSLHEVGADRVLRKPLVMEELLVAVQEVANRSSPAARIPE